MRLLCLFLACVAATAAVASEERLPEVERMVARAELRGSALVNFLSFPLYEAQLWTPEQRSVDRVGSFALSLTYKRSFKAGSLARSSVSEIARMEDRPTSDFDDLEAKLRGCFVDVTADDRITGVSSSPDSATFFINGERSCAVIYPDLRDRFFGIWLGSDTRDPEVTARLRGDP